MPESSTLEELLRGEAKFRYMVLSKMKADCEYYIGWGSRNKNRLWAHDVRTQIEYMIALHNSFPENEKPKWLSLRQIIRYSNIMLHPKHEDFFCATCDITFNGAVNHDGSTKLSVCECCGGKVFKTMIH